MIGKISFDCFERHFDEFVINCAAKSPHLMHCAALRTKSIWRCPRHLVDTFCVFHSTCCLRQLRCFSCLVTLQATHFCVLAEGTLFRANFHTPRVPRKLFLVKWMEFYGTKFFSI